MSDNGTEHSGISVPGPGRLATSKIIKRRPPEVLRDEEVSGISAIRTSIMPTQTNMTAPPRTMSIFTTARGRFVT